MRVSGEYIVCWRNLACACWRCAQANHKRQLNDKMDARQKMLWQDVQNHQALDILDVEISLRRERLRWFGHLERQAPDAWLNAIRTFMVPGNVLRGRPCKRWSDCVRADLAACKLKREDAKDRELWRASIRKTGHDQRVQPPSTRNKRR